MPALLPTELLALLVVALIIRAVNRGSPFWQRLVTGLVYWPPPPEPAIAAFVKESSQNARSFASTGHLERHAGDLAGVLVDAGAKRVPLASSFIGDAFGWADVLLGDTANVLVMTGVYSAFAVLLGGALVSCATRLAPVDVESARRAAPECGVGRFSA